MILGQHSWSRPGAETAGSGARPGANPAAVNRQERAPRFGWARPRTLIGLAAGALGLVLISRQVLGLNWGEVWARLQGANLLLVMLAFVVFYAMFPVRTVRWRLLLENAGATAAMTVPPPFRGLLEIMYRAWFVNCVTVARLGDLYRGDLLKRASGAPLALTLGTVVAERVLDLVGLGLLLIVAAPLAFGGQIPAVAWTAAGMVLAVGVLALAALAGARRFRERVVGLLPDRFRAGALALLDGAGSSFRRGPALAALTAGGWVLETVSLYLIALALGAPVSPAGAAVVALAGAALSAIPITPSGTGFAEAGMIGLLIALGVAPDNAAAITVLVRLVNYWSIVLIGSLLLLLRRERAARAERFTAGAEPLPAP